MPRKVHKRVSKKRKTKSSKKSQKRSKTAGMLSAFRKMTSRRTLEDKLYKDIENLLDIKKPKNKKDRDNLADFILRNTSKQNKKNIYFPLKSNLYLIAEKISYLQVTNPHKQSLLKFLKSTLKVFVGKNNIDIVMAKLRAPSDISSRNNADLLEAFANFDLSNSKSKMKSAMKNMNSRLGQTNRSAKAFVGNNSNNDWIKVDNSEVNTLMNQARYSMLSNMPSVPTTIPKAKGGSRKNKNLRKLVYV